MLCELCQSIEWDDLDQDYNDFGYPGHPHHNSFAALSTCNDCDFCALLLQSISIEEDLQTGDQGWQQHPMYLRVFPSSDPLGDEANKSNLLVYTTPNAHNELEQKALVKFGLYVERTEKELKTIKMDKSNPASAFMQGRPVSSNSNSDECFRLSNAWLDQCIGKSRQPNSPHCSHEGLIESGPPVPALADNEVFFPTRTIDVGLEMGDCEPRLVDHSKTKVVSIPAYATLSHCWGGSSPLKTTLSELKERETPIPLDTMPRTFHDAVIITRKLGIRHLWIDSLCIIQDSPEDWKTQASLMGKVYKYGMLNIAANIGRGCDEGIFSPRESSPNQVKLPFKSMKQSISSHMYVRPGNWRYFRPSIMGEDSTISARGWVLQESVLSPRTLHYSKQQMLWECEHLTFAEACILPISFNQTYQGQLLATLDSNKMMRPASLFRNGSPQERRAAIYFAWLSVVQNYTRRSLTFQSDIFAALGGVASEFQAELRDRYLAGLFEGDLLTSLLWQSASPASAKRRTTPSAPSWTWAAIVGPVDPGIAVNSNMVAPTLVGEGAAKIVEAAITKIDGTTTRAHDLTDIKSGRLVVEGHVLQESDVNDLQDLCYLRTDAQNFPERSTTIPNYEAYRQGRYHFDTNEDSQVHLNKPFAILHMGIWEWWYRGSISRFTRRFVGLLLKALDDTGTGVYERIGTVTMEVAFHNVTVDSMFEPKDEERIQRWERRKITIV
ncbi:hypothetical protein ACEPPN_013211 [Leptodophora sp. 'Broadleaf-Isolate-01']